MTFFARIRKQVDTLQLDVLVAGGAVRPLKTSGAFTPNPRQRPLKRAGLLRQTLRQHPQIQTHHPISTATLPVAKGNIPFVNLQKNAPAFISQGILIIIAFSPQDLYNRTLG